MIMMLSSLLNPLNFELVELKMQEFFLLIQNLKKERNKNSITILIIYTYHLRISCSSVTLLFIR